MKIIPLLIAMTKSSRAGENLSDVEMNSSQFVEYQKLESQGLSHGDLNQEKLLCKKVHKLVDYYLRCTNQKVTFREVSFEPLFSDYEPALDARSLNGFYKGLIDYYKTRENEGVEDAVLESSKSLSELDNDRLFYVDVAEMGKVSFLKMAKLFTDKYKETLVTGVKKMVEDMVEEIGSYVFQKVERAALPSDATLGSLEVDSAFGGGGVGFAGAVEELAESPRASVALRSPVIPGGMKRSPTQQRFFPGK